MIRISRIIAKERIADLLDLKYVSKVELRQGKQGFKNPAICRVEIYLQVDDDTSYFNSIMNNIVEWGKKHNCNTAVTTANMALYDRFIKESAFDDFDYPMPRRYKDLCNVYSGEYFKLFNRRKI
jgi:hypothetical protein